MSTYIPLGDLKGLTYSKNDFEVDKIEISQLEAGDNDFQVVQTSPFSFRLKGRILQKKDFQLNLKILVFSLITVTIAVTFIFLTFVMQGSGESLENVAFLHVEKPKQRKTYPANVTVSSHRMLRLITRDTRTVIINGLTAEAKPGPAGLSANCCNSVKNLTLVGPIRKSWLHYALRSFRFVETLCVNVDQVSSLWNSELKEEHYKLGENLKNIDFVNLRNIYFMNSVKMPILNWEVKIVAKKVEKVVVKDADFRESSWHEFLNFVRNFSTRNFHVELVEPVRLCSSCRESLSNLRLLNVEGMKPVGFWD